MVTSRRLFARLRERRSPDRPHRHSRHVTFPCLRESYLCSARIPRLGTNTPYRRAACNVVVAARKFALCHEEIPFMSSVYLAVTIFAAAANMYAATNDFTRPAWILTTMNKLGVRQRWLATLGVLKLLGAIGLLVGIAVPLVGIAASSGLVLFFLAAILTTLRARFYAHLPYPLLWLSLDRKSVV